MAKFTVSDENFDESKSQFDLNRLRTDLAFQKQGEIPEAPWRYFKGILCGYEPRQIEEKCHLAKKTVAVALNRDIKDYLLRILQRPDDTRISSWVIVRKWVLDAGYGVGKNHCINWQQVCRTMLDRQIQFPTLNDLMAKDGVRIDPAIFVPVGLIERKQRQYQRFDVDSAEQGSQLLQPVEEEIVHRFDTSKAFFDRVICNPDVPSGSRLVITGEPGSGKTTLLQKIGDRLLQAGLFPIWVSLGKEGSSPTQTLVRRVLRKNAQPQDLSSSNWDESINALLQTGKVWLLLDGADELTVSRYPLRVIAEQLREEWANQVTVVLTCRLNCWDTDALPKFAVFRTLELDYHTPVEEFANQVEAYIYKFFKKAEADPQLADSLIQQLYSIGKERIRDSVRNPLRLSLLCYAWESGIGKLPDTKAELYERFVDYYYELQERKHPELEGIDRTERDALNTAFGEVAKAALDSDDSRFRLRKSLIESIPAMGQSDAKNSLFDKALHLDWLNYIGTTEEKPHEAAYAFLHPTFQEYFAALAINDWDFFLPHEHENKPVEGRNYLIFEPQWKEIILLWLGRKDLMRSTKETFIERLTELEDGCNNFYSYQAFFLAANILSEWESIHARQIIEYLLRTAFGKFDVIGEVKGVFTVEAKKPLRNSNLTRIREAIFDKFENTQDRNIHLRFANALLEINPDDQNTLMNILKPSLDSEDNFTKGCANLILGKMSYPIYKKIEQPSERKIKFFHQGELVEFEEESLIKGIEENVRKWLQDSELIVDGQFEKQELLTQDLGYILSHYSQDSISRYLIIQVIKHIFYGSLDAIRSLIKLLYCENLELFEAATFSLISISNASFFPLLVKELKLCIVNHENDKLVSYVRKQYALEILWHCAQNMSYSDFHQAWNNPSSADAELLAG